MYKVTEKRCFHILVSVLTILAILLPTAFIQTDRIERPKFVYLSDNQTDQKLNAFPEKLYTMTEILQYLKTFANERSFLFSTHQIARTHLQSNPVYEVTLQKRGRTENKILIVSGLSGKDWGSVSVTLQIMHRFFSDVQRTNRMLNTFSFHFLPLMNPDGYQFSQSLPIYSNWVYNFGGFVDGRPVGSPILHGFGNETARTAETSAFMKYFRTRKTRIKAAFFLFSPPTVNMTSGSFSVAPREVLIDELAAAVEEEGGTHFKYTKTEESYRGRIDQWVSKETEADPIPVVDLTAHYGAQPPEVFGSRIRELGNDAHFIITRLVEILHGTRRI